MKKILIAGAKGQLGIAIEHFYKHDDEIELILTDVTDLDITDKDAVIKQISKIAPDIIINCAAYTDVEWCESHEAECYLVNVEGVKNLSLAANHVNAALLHISSDYVFDGNKKTPYTEEDEPNPKSIYGKSKLSSEKYIQEVCLKYFIIRTSWLYGEGNNFIRAIKKVGETQDEIKVVMDQVGAATSANEVVKVIDLLLNSNKYGIYHCTCQGACSRADLAAFILKQYHLNKKIIPITSKEYPTKVERPKNSALSNEKLMKEFGVSLKSWQDELKLYIHEEIAKEKHSKVKKILVTGANGYLGRHVVKTLLDQGLVVLAADLSFDGIDERAICVKEPIFSGLKNIFNRLDEPDVCIHLAWRNGFVHNASTHIGDLPLHIEFIENMIKGGLSQICVMGTMHEVGYFEGAIDENTPTNPHSYYGIAKNALRQALDCMEKGDTIVQWLRAYYIVGDDVRGQSIFSKIVKAEAEGAQKFPLNSGKNKYDFINLSELAFQISIVAQQTEVDGIINCCTGEPISLGEKVEGFIKENDFNIRLEYGVFPDRTYDSPAVWGNPDKIELIKKRFGD